MDTFIEEIRKEIDKTDAAMAELFERRMNTVAALAQYKAQNGIPIEDATREKELTERNLSRLHNEALESYYRDFSSHLIKLSKNYQQTILSAYRERTKK